VKLIAFNKPYGVVCQFKPHGEDSTLADYIDISGIYAAGRLDKDSEGLLLLTDFGPLQDYIASPKNKLPKTYWVQVEGIPDHNAIKRLVQGVELKDGITLPAKVTAIEAPTIWPRTPPIRERKNIPASWLALTIREGRNRQIRRMTAAVGYPTLRLIRVAMGDWNLFEQLHNLQPGDSMQINIPDSIKHKLKPAEPKNKRAPYKKRFRKK
jgi:23S rRNA pseudouridine2457 synthase